MSPADEFKPEMLIEVPLVSPVPTVAVGAELKNTVCVLEGHTAAISPAVGALTESDSYRRFTAQLEALSTRFSGQKWAIAHDLHPASLATQYARRHKGETIAVQHHHAHVVSCMAEHGLLEPVIGISCDGTGYGADGTAWGGEVLRSKAAGFQRFAHLQYFCLPGGDAAARDSWRPALSLVGQAYGASLPAKVRRLFGEVEPERLATVEAMLRAGFNCPRTSSLGRLFDAVAFLTGCGAHNDTEGQVAIRLEQAVVSRQVGTYPFHLQRTDAATEIVLTGLVAGVCEDLVRGEPRELIASRFHETVAAMLSDAAGQAADEHGIDVAVLSGGCFFNQVLTNRLKELLGQRGFRRVLVQERVSPGDAGLSLGQAVAAAACIGRSA